MRLAEAAIPIGAKLVGDDRHFNGCSTDSRNLSPGQLFIALRGRRFDGHDFIRAAEQNGASAALVDSTPASTTLPLLVVEDTLQAMGQLAAAWRSRFDIPLFAVTGSNGKTTVKDMLASILSRHVPIVATAGNLNNEIGVPITLFALGAEHCHAVVEMGANHPGEIRRLSRLAGPTVAVITQCAPAHLEGFGSIDGVARAKAEIFAGLAAGGAAVINADDRYADLWRRASTQFRQISFGLESAADVTARQLQGAPEIDQKEFMLITPRGEIEVTVHLPGRHNVLNALAAAACCEAIGVPLEEVRSGLGAIHSLKGRLEVKTGMRASRVLDDTYNANPVSLQAALDVLHQYPGRHWLVLGDMGELGNAAVDLHYGAGETARECGVERLYAIGDLSRHAVAGFGSGARHFGAVDDLIHALQQGLGGEVTVLVKGSRAMAMERIVNAVIGGG